MRRPLAIAGSALFFVLAPVTVAGLVPYWICCWRFEHLSIAWIPARVFGAVLVIVGALTLLDSFARFALKGLGTPAPVFPTRHLVVSGLYRFVRNPMYVAILAIVLGQGLMFGNVRLLGYGAVLWLTFHLFVLVYEEPTLRRTFGAEYESFCASVPRWIPQWNPWRPLDAKSEMRTDVRHTRE
ncbi:MAG: methyltransferase family protein [Terriglobales bacterium]